MMNESTSYETMDWEAQAIRVARAFDVEEECLFIDESTPALPARRLIRRGNFLVRFFRLLISSPIKENDNVLTKDGVLLVVGYYWQTEMLFTNFQLLDNKPMTVRDRNEMGVSISHDGATVYDLSIADSQKYIIPLAKGLFHLDLLTPEVEASLKIAVSAHQKMEWTLEYEAPGGLR